MSLIKFKNCTEYIEVNLSIIPYNRIKIIFENENDIPDEAILSSGFIELNEHNFIKQSDFSDMNYIYQKIDDLTYTLTNDENDIYVIPETSISDENHKDFPEYIPEIYIPTIDEIVNSKISSLSYICNRKIVSGVDIEIDETIEHFSYTEQDQTNIKELFDLAVQTNIPMYYHSDGNSCKLYTVEQIVKLYTTAAMNKMHHITYFNQLKKYINTLDDSDIVNSIEYGFELFGEYLETYNTAMSQAKISLETLLKLKS